MQVRTTRNQGTSNQACAGRPVISPANLRCCCTVQEYAELKRSLLDNTRKSGAGIALYMLLTVDGEVRGYVHARAPTSHVLTPDA